MATLTFDNATFERAEVAAAREGRSVYDLLNATLVDYAATVPLSKVDDGIKVGADGYPEFKVNRDTACIVKPVAYREDGVGLYSHGWDDDGDIPLLDWSSAGLIRESIVRCSQIARIPRAGFLKDKPFGMLSRRAAIRVTRELTRLHPELFT